MLWQFIVFPLLAIAFVYGLSAICGGVRSEAGSSVQFRPPPVVFAVAWPLLLTFLGVSAALTIQSPAIVGTSLLYGALTVALGMWIVFYSCQQRKYAALGTLLVAIGLTLATLQIGTVPSRLLMCPLLTWLLFALLLGTTEIQHG